MDVDTLRDKFLAFFAGHNHKVLPSDSLVPACDPSVLFTSAGMNQFKRQFLGVDIQYPRVATCQKCLRTDDLDKVGRTAVHHTFFEMLGNFSFGDYFKKEAISLAWEFLTKELGIDKNKLWVSVYHEDEESLAIWLNTIGISKDKIVKLGDKENFWPSEVKANGPNGPCGPCSEIFFDWGKGVGCAKPNCSPACNCGRFSEVWNLVFTQFERKDDGNLYALPRKNIDTGMGLERLAAVMEGKENNFETDLFKPIISQVLKLVDRQVNISSPDKSFRLRAIADHIRAICFAISDGVYPSNEERGYVVRSLIRHSYLFGQELGAQGEFLYKLVEVVAGIMRSVYPELDSNCENIAQIIKSEESRFISSLETRVPEFIGALKELANKNVSQVPPETLFKFYDTFGLPWDLMENEAKKFAITCDKQEFSRLLEKQRKRSRGQSKLSSSIFVKRYDFKHEEVEFIDCQNLSAKIIAIFKQDNKDKKNLVTKASHPMQVEIVLDKTCFYPESGGQIGDSGILENDRAKVEVVDTKNIEGTIVHIGKIIKGELNINDAVNATIDAQRHLAIARNHTATHLLQAALRKVLGVHVRQQGSLVTDEYLRFDFSHPAALRQEELERIEDTVNGYIRANHKLNKEHTSLASAKKAGALAFFGERYGETVRMVSIGDYSRELCGGSHLDTTGQIGLFKIMKESSIASGIRRIQASTGEFAREFEKASKEKINQDREKIQKESREKELQQQLADKREKEFKGELPSFLNQATQVADDIKCISIFQKDADAVLLRRMADLLKNGQNKLIVILGSIWLDKGIFVISLTNDLVNKGFRSVDSKDMKGRGILNTLSVSLAKENGIKGVLGGGREALAQGSCLQEDIQKVIELAPDILKDRLKDFKL